MGARIAISSDAVWQRSLRYNGCSYHRTPKHGGSNGSSSQEASDSQAQAAPHQDIVSSRLARGYREMAARTVLFALARGGRLQVVAAKAGVGGALDGLERRANAPSTLCRHARIGA